MGIKVTQRITNSSIPGNTNTTVLSDIPEGESFQDVLVLNQTALKAMAIDAMVAKSATGSVDPDAVDAAAIMKFRNTLASHIIAPIPEDDQWKKNPQVPTAVPNSDKDNESNKTPDTTHPPTNHPMEYQPISSTPSEYNPTSTTPTEAANSVIYNSDNLQCSDELNRYFQEASTTYGVDFKLLKSIAFCESSFNPECTSHSGAMGIMQLMPETAAELGVSNPYNSRENILGGAKYISKMITRYNGDLSLALAAYNAGPGNVDRYNGIPPFEETQNYVTKVLGYFHA